MALTWVVDDSGRQNLGPSGVVTPAYATPAASDYVTGGYSVPPSTFGFAGLYGLLGLGVSGGTTTAYLWQYNPLTGMLQVFESGPEDVSATPFAEVAAATNLSALTLVVIAWGW